MNRSRLATVVCIPLTSNLTWAAAPVNTLLSATASGLAKDSVANATQLVAVDRAVLTKRIGKPVPNCLQQVLTTIDVLLGR